LHGLLLIVVRSFNFSRESVERFVTDPTEITRPTVFGKTNLEHGSDMDCCGSQITDAAVGLRIIFSLCLVAVLFGGLYFIKNRRQLFGRDSQVTADTWAARNLRLWQVILVWILAMDLLITMLLRL
jgi:hypothetical protein